LSGFFVSINSEFLSLPLTFLGTVALKTYEISFDVPQSGKALKSSVFHPLNMDFLYPPKENSPMSHHDGTEVDLYPRRYVGLLSCQVFEPFVAHCQSC
jgi:hypothetical protein